MANIKLKNCFISENVIISSDNKISIINMFSEIKSLGFPVMFPKFNILVSISGDIGEYKEVIEIVSVLDNKVIVKTDGLAKIDGLGGHNFLATFVNIPFTNEGTYWIKVTVDGEVITNKNENTILLKKVTQ